MVYLIMVVRKLYISIKYMDVFWDQLQCSHVAAMN